MKIELFEDLKNQGFAVSRNQGFRFLMCLRNP
jgi:hypothetical protein